MGEGTVYMTDTAGTADTSAVIAAVARGGRLPVVAALVRLTGDFDLAEDCWQDAVERALARWPADGVPDRPQAWLMVAARNRAVDALRRRRTETDRLSELHAQTEQVGAPSDQPETPYDDDRLKLLFACCHPALPMAGRVALTLKTVAGLSTREVAQAFLVSEATMGQRLLRAKTKIAHAGIALRVPPADQLGGRIDAVLAVLYLLFNHGYADPGSEPARDRLVPEAIQLAALVHELLPRHGEARALLALMLIQDSRRQARLNAAGELVPLDEQDRRLWNSGRIQAGLRLLLVTADEPPGPYQLQAAIAALHATAPRVDQTDWVRIVQAYDALLAIRDNPVVALNRLIAVSHRDGPATALELLPQLAAALAGYPALPAVRADLLRRSGRFDEAEQAYRVAIGCARTDGERRFLQRRLRQGCSP